MRQLFYPLCAGLLWIGLTAQVCALPNPAKPFALGQAPADVPKAMTLLRVAQLDKALLANWRQENPESLSLSLPLPTGEVATLQLTGSGAISARQTIRETGNQTVRVDRGLHYHTTKASESQGALSLFRLEAGQFQLSGLFFHKGRTWVLALNEAGQTIIYPEDQLPGKNPFDCHTDALQTSRARRPRPGTPNPSPQACRQVVSFFVEADSRVFRDNGLSRARTVAWVNTVMNVTGKLYADINVPIEVAEVYIHTVADNYSTTSSLNALLQFGDTVQARNVTASLSHLISTKPTRLGGIAYLDAVCGGSFGTGFSNTDFAYEKVPTYSWTVNVLAHEIGHNMGSHHTQWCGWEVAPGQTGSIDSCWATEPDNGVGCYSGPNIGRVGTIMSYCHLTGSVNLALGFGPLPSAVIQEGYLNGSSCMPLGTGAPNADFVGELSACPGQPLNLTVGSVPNATYRWTGPGGFVSTQRTPVVANFAANQAGTYAVTITTNGCATQPFETVVTSDCFNLVAEAVAPLCPAEPLAVTFSTNYPATAGNQYRLELSDATGSFANATTIGSIAGAGSPATVIGQIPGNIAAGGQYRFRLRGTAPAQLSTNPSPAFAIRARSAAPSTTPGSRFGPGTVTLQATAPAGLRLAWYSDSNSLAVLSRSSSFVTPSITATRRYWVEAQPVQNVRAGLADRGSLAGSQSQSFEHGLHFTALQAMTLDSVTIWVSGTGTLVVLVRDRSTQRNVFRRQFALSGNGTVAQRISLGAHLTAGRYSLLASNETTGLTLYRTRLAAGTLPYPYTTSGIVRVDSATQMGLTSGVPNSLQIYNFFYNWRVRPLACTSARVPVLATINTNNCAPPSAPAAAGQTICLGGSATLTATGQTAGFEYRWFSSPTGDVTLPSGQSASVVVNPSQTTTYYVALQSSTNPACSTARTPVTVTVVVPPASPTAAGATACTNTAITLTATGQTTGYQFRWFDRPTAGTVLSQAASYSPTVTRTDTFFVGLVGTATPSCSTGRTPVVVTVRPAVAQPTAVADSACFGRPVSFRASALAAGQVYLWHDRPAAGTLLQQTSSNTFAYTPSAIRDTLFLSAAYATAPACASARRAIIVRSARTPASVTVSDQSACGPASFRFAASAPITADTVRWLSATGGLLARGPAYNTPLLASTQSYQVQVSSSLGCRSQAQAFRAIVLPVPARPSISFGGGVLSSSFVGTNQWLLNGLPVADTARQITQPALGIWQVIAKQGPCLSDTSAPFIVTSIDGSAQGGLPTLYPNPAHGYVTLSGTNGYTQYELLSVLGRVVEHGILSPILAVGHLATGVYAIRLSGPRKPTVWLRLEKI